jgi:hypothetical protein
MQKGFNMAQHSPLAALVLIAAASALAAQDHAIRLDRLPKAGSVIEVASSTEQSGDLGPVLARAKRAGVTGQFKTPATIALRITIDEVAADGRATKATYAVLRCDVTTPRGKAASYITGKTFEVAVNNGKRMYLGTTGVAGEKWVLEEPNASMLDAAVPLSFFQGEPAFDTLFGTTQRQKSGATWPADPQALAAGFHHLGATKERATGKSSLKKGRGKLLTVQSDAEFSALKHDLPDGYQLAEDKFQMQLITSLPADEAALPAEQAIVRYLAISGINGGKKSVEWLRETGHARYKVVK